MNRIRKGDQVIVTAGSDKGKTGEVVRMAGDRVVVQNVNMIKRHTKANKLVLKCLRMDANCVCSAQAVRRLTPKE
jgi:ribosomal protein L24